MSISKDPTSPDYKPSKPPLNADTPYVPPSPARIYNPAGRSKLQRIVSKFNWVIHFRLTPTPQLYGAGMLDSDMQVSSMSHLYMEQYRRAGELLRRELRKDMEANLQLERSRIEAANKEKLQKKKSPLDTKP